MGEAIKTLILLNNDQRKYLHKIHGKSKGWICKAEKKKSFTQWHFKYSELVNQNLVGENIYITLNTFYKTYRRIEYIRELNANYIDLDTYKTKFTKEQILMNLEKNYFNKKIPTPTFVINSGNGLYLIWKIKSVPSQALPLWKAVQDYLYNILKPYGADRQALDCTRVLRIVGSKNSRTGNLAQILDTYDYIYDLREIQKEFLPELKIKSKNKEKLRKINFIYRERSLYYARIQDIIKLCELREYNLKGHREVILFLYRYYLCSFLNNIEKALDDVLELNNQFKEPLPEKEVIRATKSAEKCYLNKKKEYKYKNKTLIDLLEITTEEEFHMKTIISQAEYRRRDRLYKKNMYYESLRIKGKLSKKEELQILRNKIRALRLEGYKNKTIMKMVGIVSTTTYERHISFLKKNNMI